MGSEVGDCLLLHLKYKLHAELADGTASAAFCDLMDIFEPLPPEIMRWIDGDGLLRVLAA